MVKHWLWNSPIPALLNKGESLAIFQQMLEDGFWLAPDTVVEFEKMLLLM
jgi:hypothetical protein